MVAFSSARIDPCGCHCPVCRTALDTEILRCPRCDTPHHVDCWDYAGGCAVYACQPVDPGVRAGARFRLFLQTVTWLIAFGAAAWCLVPSGQAGRIHRWMSPPSAARAEPPAVPLGMGRGPRLVYFR